MGTASAVPIFSSFLLGLANDNSADSMQSIMRDKSSLHAAIHTAALEGARRCANSRDLGTAASVPPIRFIGQELELCARQRVVFKQASLDILQVELLKRATSFLEFWDTNVGGTDEFPLVLHGDHIEAINLLNTQLSKLQAAVGVLSEV